MSTPGTLPCGCRPPDVECPQHRDARLMALPQGERVRERRRLAALRRAAAPPRAET